MKRFAALLLIALALTGLYVPATVHARVSSTTNRITYAGNGSTTAFAVPFYFLANADLVVIERNNSTNVETTKTITSHYTVSGAGQVAGGTVTMVTAPASGTTLIIYRDPSKLQDLDLRNNAPLPADEVEAKLDRLTMITQRLGEQVSRCLRMTDGNPTSVNMTLPTTLAASSVPVLNATGTGWSLSTLSASAADLSALTGGGNTTLHFHDADRARSNHTGTQLASTISDFTAAVELISTATPAANKIPEADGSGKLAAGWLSEIANANVSATAGILLTKLESIATDKLLGRTSSGSGAIEQLTITDFVQTLLDDTDAATFRATIGAPASTITISTSGGITGGGDLSANRTLTIADNALSFTKLQGASSQSRLFGTFGGSSTQGVEYRLTSNIEAFDTGGGIPGLKVTDGGVGTATLADNGVTSAKILDGAVALGDMASLSAGTILARGSDQGTGAPQALTIGAGLTSAGGVLAAAGGAATITVQEGGVTEGSGSFNTTNFSDDDFDISESPASAAVIVLATNAVESATIQDDTIVNGDINSAAAIAYSKLNLATSIVNADISASAAIVYSKLAFSNNIVAGDLADNSVGAGEIVGGAPGATGAEFADSVTNITAATDLTITATGDEVILGDQIKLFGTTSDPTNEQDVSYDTGEKLAQQKIGVGRATWGGVIHRIVADSTEVSGITAGTDFSNGSTTILANGLQANQVITIIVGGMYDSDAAPGTHTLILKYGSTAIWTSEALTPVANANDVAWFAVITVTVRSTTSVAAAGQFSLHASNLANRNFGWTTSVTTALTTTSDTALKLTIAHADSGSKSTLQTGHFRVD